MDTTTNYKQFVQAALQLKLEPEYNANLIAAMRKYKIGTAQVPALATFLEAEAARTRIVFHKFINAQLLKSVKAIAHLF